MIRLLRKRFHTSERGQALIEYALVIPILLALLVGIIEVGRCWSTYQMVTHAAREGARHSSLPSSSEEETVAKIHEVLEQGSLDTTLSDAVLRVRQGTGTADTVEVGYQYQFFLLGGVLRLISSPGAQEMPGTVRLSSTFIMRNE